MRRVAMAVLALATGCAPEAPRQADDATNRTALLLDPANPAWQEPAPAVAHLRFETSKGTFVLELNRSWGPLGADRVWNLARLGYYDDTRVHRMRPGYIAQFGIHGDPAVNSAWASRALPDDPPRSGHVRGTWALAYAAQPGTRNTQIFINLAENTRNDAEPFTILGTVVEGLEVVDSLYGGYGEDSGSGMRQGRQPPLLEGGNVFMDREYPLLDRIVRVTATVVTPAP